MFCKIFSKRSKGLPAIPGILLSLLFLGFGRGRAEFPVTHAPRAMAEWEESEALFLTWDTEGDGSVFNPVFVEIVRHAIDEVPVFIVCRDKRNITEYLLDNSIPLDRITLIDDLLFDSIWFRDYGPISVYDQMASNLILLDCRYPEFRPNDDIISAPISERMNIPLFQAHVPPNNFYSTGGNTLFDGHGTSFATGLLSYYNKSRTREELDRLMLDYFGVTRNIILPWDKTRHIDMFMKLLDEETILIGEYPAKDYGKALLVDSNLRFILDNFKTCFGRDYRVFRVPMPETAPGYYISNDGNFRTYANSLILNRSVFVPVFGIPEDDIALKVYREAMPGYKVVPINCDEQILLSGGALHCLTREIGTKDPLYISHARLLDQNANDSGYPVAAYIKSRSGIVSASVAWENVSTHESGIMFMQRTAPDTFVTTIPPQPGGTAVRYFISATNDNGKTITKPMTAPDGYYEFTILTPTNVIATAGLIPETYSLGQNFPNPFNSETTIEFTLPGQSDIQLAIYDVTGFQVAKLYEGRHAAGDFRIQWDGKSNTGNPVASGQYYYSLKSGPQTVIKRMTVLR